MAHMAHVVHHVEIAGAVVGDEARALAANDLERGLIRQAERAADHVSTLALQPRGVSFDINAAINRKSEHMIRIHEHAGPCVPLTAGNHADDLRGAPPAQIAHQLKVKVRLPATVFI